MVPLLLLIDGRAMSLIDQSIDASGLECPLPLLKMKLALNKMTSGEILEVIATDMSSERDFKAFCDMTNNEMLLCKKESHRVIFHIRK